MAYRILPRSLLTLLCPCPMHICSLAPTPPFRPLPQGHVQSPSVCHRTPALSPSPLWPQPGPRQLALPWSRPQEATPPQILCLDPASGGAPAASPGIGAWYPAQPMQGRICWYRAHKEGWSFQWQHQCCGSSSSSVENSVMLGWGWGHGRPADPAGRFGGAV